MAPYIFGKRNLIHIIDLKETIKGLIRSARFLVRLSARGEEILFVGTKRQARVSVETQAKRCGMPYVSERWLGGTLTNFRTITSRVKRLEELEELETSGRIQLYSKKMIAGLQREMRKMRRNLEGIRNMKKLPGALVIVDPRHERIAVAEARKLGIPTICLMDTDSDPEMADIPTPGNDDAIRSIQLYIKRMTDAVLEGKKSAPKAPARKTKAAAGEEKAAASPKAGAGPERARRGRRPPPRRGGSTRTTQRLPGGRVVTTEKPSASRREGRRTGRRVGAGRTPAESAPKPPQSGEEEPKPTPKETAKAETPETSKAGAKEPEVAATETQKPKTEAAAPEAPKEETKPTPAAETDGDKAES